MLLAKSCYAKDHIQSCNTVKVGSLNEYKQTEQQQTADRHEGLLKFHLTFDEEVTVSKKWFNALFGGTVVYATPDNEPPPKAFYETIIEKLKITKVTDNHVTITDSAVSIETQADNCFIFCMSEVNRKEEAIGIFPDYDSYWYIKSQHQNLFGRYLGKILHDHVIAEHKRGNYIIPKETNVSTLETGYVGVPVTYLDRDIHINNKNIIEFDDLMHRISRVPMTKPPVPFAKEREMRFFYIMHSDGQLIVPNKNYAIVDATYLQQFVV